MKKVYIVYGLDAFIISFLVLSRFTMLKVVVNSWIEYYIVTLREFFVIKAVISAFITWIVLLIKKKLNARDYNAMALTIAVLVLASIIIWLAYCAVMYIKTIH